MRCHWMWSFDKERLETGAERPRAKPRKGEGGGRRLSGLESNNPSVWSGRGRNFSSWNSVQFELRCK